MLDKEMKNEKKRKRNEECRHKAGSKTDRRREGKGHTGISLR